MLRVFAWPQTKAVVVFGCQDERPKARSTRRSRPLMCIAGDGIEEGRILLAIAPRAIGEGVDPEVYEKRPFVALPIQLIASRRRPGLGARRPNGVSGGRDHRGSRHGQKLASGQHGRFTLT